jgi:hypothetical protein
MQKPLHCSVAMANQGPQGPQMSHMAKLRSEHHQLFLPIVVSSRKAALKGRLFLSGTIYVQATLFMPVFLPFGKVARIFPLHLPSVLERRRFWGGVSELEGHLPVLESLRGALASRTFGCPGALSGRLGRPLA